MRCRMEYRKHKKERKFFTMIYTITLNPAWDLTYLVPGLSMGLNRAYSCAGKAGGKGINVSRAILADGGRCVTLAALAGETGQTIAGALASEGISPVVFAGEGNTRTNISAIADDGTSLEINGPGATLSEETFSAMLSYLGEKLHGGDILCLCGSLPPYLGENGAHNTGVMLYTRLCKLAGERGASVALDCSGAALIDALDSEYPPALIKPNAAELADLCTRRGNTAVITDKNATEESLRRMASEAVDLTKTAVLCTLGSRGALWMDADSTVMVPAERVERAKAEKGAGDTYLGVFLWHRYGLREPVDTAMGAAAQAAAGLVKGE